MKVNRCPNKPLLIMHFSEFDVTNAVKTFVRNAELNHIMQDLLARNGSNEKEPMHADSAQAK